MTVVTAKTWPTTRMALLASVALAIVLVAFAFVNFALALAAARAYDQQPFAELATGRAAATRRG